jgi:gamma-glutamyltranspeptidase/glutathione hydrolase
MLAPARRHAAPGTLGRLGLLLALAAPLAAVATPVRAQRPAQERQPLPAATATGGMVVSASALASAVGRDVLANGGNAVDAAIATGFALAVTYPTAGNIGGGGFMVIRFPDGRATTIDFREKAPAKASPTMFLDSAGNYSARIHHNTHVAVGVPGTVAGFALAHQQYGKVSWAKTVDPAARMASEGFLVPTGLAASLASVQRRLSAFPASAAAYYKNGQPYAAGDRMVLADLGKTLARVRDQGRDGFYTGDTARLIAAEMARHGGLIAEADLAAYQAKERPALVGSYRGVQVIGMAPPSSGGTAMIEMLNILEGFDLKGLGHNTSPYLHLLAEGMRRAFRDRAVHLGDPDFSAVPVARLTDKGYAAQLRATIDRERASPSSPADVTQGYESDETTHYSVVDANGMAVSVTYTLEAGYGLGAVVDGAGFLLNNEMGDFNGKPGLTDSTGLIGTLPNQAQPGKRMLSSMSPTILAKDGQLLAVTGSPGGRTIINTVLQVVLNLVEFGMPVADAVQAARIHHQWLPNRLTVERGMDDGVVAALRSLGHDVRVGGQQGTAHSIAVDPTTGVRTGAPDARDRDAGAAGHDKAGGR